MRILRSEFVLSRVQAISRLFGLISDLHSRDSRLPFSMPSMALVLPSAQGQGLDVWNPLQGHRFNPTLQLLGEGKLLLQRIQATFQSRELCF